jgi:hypothetical protein
MPLSPLVKGLIKATMVGSPEGKLGACIINNTPVVTHLFDNDCVPIMYTRLIRRKLRPINLGRMAKELDGIRGDMYRYLVRITINGTVYEAKVNTINALGLTGMAIDGDYIVLNRSKYTYIINPISIPTGLEEAVNRLKLPELEYTTVAEDSLEGSILGSIIRSISYYYPGSWRSGFLYICRSGATEEPPEGEDCLPIRYMRRIINDLSLDITGEFSIAGVNTEALIGRASWLYPIFVKLRSIHGTAHAYALVAVNHEVVPSGYRLYMLLFHEHPRGHVMDTVFVSTPSLRRLINRIMSTINSTPSVDDVLREANLTP